jgi:diguanylate cyclase (GGDEF)-like protein
MNFAMDRPRPQWYKAMPETVMSGRAWRIDRIRPFPSQTQSEEAGSVEPARKDYGLDLRAADYEQGFRQAGLVARLGRAARGWVWRRFGRRWLAHEQFEDAVHRFAGLIERADDSAVVEAELLRIVREIAPGSRVELVCLAESHHHDQNGDRGDLDGSASPGGVNQRMLEIPLRCGASISARLRIRPRPSGKTSYRTEEVRRLRTIATMAACAMQGLGCLTEWPGIHLMDADRGKSPSRDVAHADVNRPTVQLQDATFLNAVLPFALSQARRHREPLSIVCVAIDRLSAIKQLLGRAESDRLVQHVAQTAGATIRSSDIVARLDDDRIVAVLPRAPRGGALHVAESICRAVQENSPPGCETPSLTVSIGAATFPSCADDVYSLFDAADEALAWAQKNGRSQAVVARPRPLAGTYRQ